MIGDHVLVIALMHWQTWDKATRDAWTEAWDEAWEEADEREPESGA